MPPITITVEVPSTATLRNAYFNAARRPSTSITVQKNGHGPGSEAEPLVVIQGSPALRLQAAGAPANHRIWWSLVPHGSTRSALVGPRLQRTEGPANQLSTNAVGDYVVSVGYYVPGAQTTIERTRLFLRFVSGTLSIDSYDEDNAPEPTLQGATRVTFIGWFSFEATVRLSSSAALVRVGVIQNITEDAMHELYGVYSCRSGGFGIQEKRLFEAYPAQTCPFVDCSEDLPFYDITTRGAAGLVRTLELMDGPGLVTPSSYDPRNSNSAVFDPRACRLTGAGGCNSFRSAIVAVSRHLPTTYMVLGWLDWELVLNHKVVLVPDKSRFGLRIAKHETTGREGTFFLAQRVLRLPKEACAAGIETYGPTATGEEEDEADYSKYRWE